jgi:hypothetical protein
MSRAFILMLLLAATAQAVDFPIGVVRAPRYGDGTQPGDRRVNVPEVINPVAVEIGSDFVRINPNGTEDMLLDSGEFGAILDPKTYDGVWVFFSWIKDARPTATTGAGADGYKINVVTGELRQLTFGEFTPNTGVANWHPDPLNGSYPNPRGLGHANHNLGWQPLGNGRVAFTSSRNGYLPTHATTFTNQQLFLMDEDGKNVEQTGFINLGSALHPTLLKNRRILWSSAETQGHRNGHHWSLWTSNPDLTDWESVFFNSNGGGAASSTHFQSQWSDGDIAVIRYYLSNNFAFGAMYGIPSATPTVGVSVWGHPKASLNPPLSGQYAHFFPFQRHGMWAATPWTTDLDIPAPGNLGKVSMPSAAPGNRMLVCYSPGPVSNTGPAPTPWLHSKIAIMNGKTTTGPGDLEIVASNPAYNYLQPIALVHWDQIYGGHTAPEIPECPRSNHPALPPGSPFGLVGWGSLYKRETATENPGEAWVGQGTGPEFASSDIAKVRVIVQENTSEYREYPYFTATGMERFRVLGEFSPRKAAGIIDLNGDPDTSGLIKLPADTSWTLQILNAAGEVLTPKPNWNTVRPGETIVKCSGCHAHHDSGRADFATTAAAQPDYPLVDLTSATPWTVEWNRDVWPILEAKCASCHDGVTAQPVIDHGFGRSGSTTLANVYVFGYSARNSVIYTKAKEGHGGLTSAELLKLAQWIDLGCQRDLPAAGQPGRIFQDDSRPTLFLDSPRIKELAPLDLIRIGAHDYFSGIASLSVKASWSVNGISAGEEIGHLFTTSNSISTLSLTTPFSGSGQLTVIATDTTGNKTKLVRDFTVAEAPPPVRTPKGVYLGFDGDHLGDLRDVNPDGLLDHHIRLEGLRHPISHIEIKAGSGPTDFKWSNRAGGETPEHPQGTWWYVMHSPRFPGSPVGVLNVRFSEPTRDAPHTDFRVYVFYSDEPGDYDTIIPTLPEPCNNSVLKAKIDAARIHLEAANAALAP